MEVVNESLNHAQPNPNNSKKTILTVVLILFVISLPIIGIIILFQNKNSKSSPPTPQNPKMTTVNKTIPSPTTIEGKTYKNISGKFTVYIQDGYIVRDNTSASTSAKNTVFTEIFIPRPTGEAGITVTIYSKSTSLPIDEIIQRDTLCPEVNKHTPELINIGKEEGKLYTNVTCQKDITLSLIYLPHQDMAYTILLQKDSHSDFASLKPLVMPLLSSLRFTSQTVDD